MNDFIQKDSSVEFNQQVDSFCEEMGANRVALIEAITLCMHRYNISLKTREKWTVADIVQKNRAL